MDNSLVPSEVGEEEEGEREAKSLVLDRSPLCTAAPAHSKSALGLLLIIVTPHMTRLGDGQSSARPPAPSRGELPQRLSLMSYTVEISVAQS